MSQFLIQGGKQLKGTIAVNGSKNAALPLISAALLTRDRVEISNVPKIADVTRLLEIVETMGVAVEKKADSIVLEAKEVDPKHMPKEKVGMLRGSILLFGALLGRNRYAALPRPGGDVIGSRPIDVHLDAFTQLGAKVKHEEGMVIIDGADMAAGEVTLSEFSVTATENVLLAVATLPGTTTIYTAAAEPHVVALAELLQAMGATIEGAGTHTIRVTGAETLHGASIRNIPDMLEAGLFILLAAGTQSELTIQGVPYGDLRLFFKKLDEIGVVYEMREKTVGDIADVTVRPSGLRGFKLQVLPHPGIATDLQAPFSVIATQAQGTSLIHDPLYESRFRHIPELQKMGADAIICDPHRVIINGPTKLYGQEIPSLDIRSGATLILAGLIAEGKTLIDEAEIIDRGYSQLTERLQAIGADIVRIGSGQPVVAQ